MILFDFAFESSTLYPVFCKLNLLLERRFIRTGVEILRWIQSLRRILVQNLRRCVPLAIQAWSALVSLVDNTFMYCLRFSRAIVRDFLTPLVLVLEVLIVWLQEVRLVALSAYSMLASEIFAAYRMHKLNRSNSRGIRSPHAGSQPCLTTAVCSMASAWFLNQVRKLGSQQRFTKIGARVGTVIGCMTDYRCN
jgi:hypothetical protein